MFYHLKKYLTAILLVALTATILAPVSITYADTQWPAGPEVKAASAIVMEADSGAILYEKEIHAQHYPASITKIMTTLLALENSSLQDTVTFSFDAIHNTEGSLVGYIDGEEITMESCLYSVMLASANEAAYATAEHVAGSIPAFVEMMNKRALELGCTETHFSNPHGLPDETHVTSAHDMALIARAAYNNEAFRTITKTVKYVVPPTNKVAETRELYNHHKMLKQGPYKYDACTGGKTGYTNIARNTLVTFAEKNGIKLISVIMQDDVSEDQYLDTIALLDYGFNNFKKIPVTESDLGLQLSSDGLFPMGDSPFKKDMGVISLDQNASLVLPNQASLSDIHSTISFTGKNKGQIAQVTCQLGEHTLGAVDIHYSPGKNSSALSSTATPTQPKTSKPFPVKKVLIIIFIVLCMLGFLLVVLFAIRNGLFEIQHQPKRKKVQHNRKINRKPINKAPKNHVSNAHVGSSHTPRLKSEFSDTTSARTERSRWTPDDFQDLDDL